MAISDAYVDITCDKCGESEQIQLNYVYATMSPSSGHYASDGKALRKLAEKAGWRVDSDDKHTCSGCVEDEA